MLNMISRRNFLLSSFATGAGVAVAPCLVAGTRPAANISSHSYHYSRLFPARPASKPGSDLEKGLIDLARQMRDDEGAKGDSDIVAGYTYLGQFIDHDLTLDITPLDRVTDKVEHTQNFRTPLLDLDQVYGGGPNISPFLYRKPGSDSPQGAERFLLGPTKESRVVTATGQSVMLPSSCNDLPRNSQGTALVGDARQDENLILAQLHIAFLKLHNYVLDHPETLSAPYCNIEPRFDAARRLVTWHYQSIVRHDFLKSILDPDVFSQLDRHAYKSLIRRSSEDFQIPVEFSAAAFRFGHSMVRHEYHYNFWHGEPPANLLDDLFQHTGFGEPGCVPLPADWVIDWNRFFKVRDAFHFETTRKIDTRIAEDLFRLPSAHIRAFSAVSNPKTAFAPDPPELPVRTLLRGARMGLPTGQNVGRKVLRLEPKTRILKAGEIASGPHGPTLTQYGFDHNTPLWYYILKEAEVIGSGKRLGPIGSRIVADVIVAALRADPKSYVNVAGSDWRPTLWAPASENETPTGMAKLLDLVTSGSAAEGDPKACSNT
jgi:hypothetical protein